MAGAELFSEVAAQGFERTSIPRLVVHGVAYKRKRVPKNVKINCYCTFYYSWGQETKEEIRFRRRWRQRGRWRRRRAQGEYFRWSSAMGKITLMFTTTVIQNTNFVWPISTAVDPCWFIWASRGLKRSQDQRTKLYSQQYDTYGTYFLISISVGRISPLTLPRPSTNNIKPSPSSSLWHHHYRICQFVNDSPKE